MASVVNKVKTNGNGVTTLTTGSVTPGGTDRVCLATLVSYENHATDAKIGGSGGTSLTNILAGSQITFFAVQHSVWALAGSPAGSTTGFADWGANSQASAVALFLFLSGADQTTPLDTSITPSADPGSGGGTAVAESVMTGLDPGQLVVASLGISAINGVASVVANNGATNVEDTESAGGGVALGGSWIWGVADGSGNLTLSVTITEGAPGTLIGWRLAPYPVNNAAGGAASILLQVMQHGSA